MVFRRIFVIVIDGGGIGEAPDAALFSDSGSSTIPHIASEVGLDVPNLMKLGLGRICDLPKSDDLNLIGCFGKMQEKNPAKNSDVGHWEMMGYIKDPAFKVYPEGFPKELVSALEKLTGQKFIGNKRASGTDIIKELGRQHIDSKKLILYTSADSVMQIACHTDVLPIDKQYELCRIARELCQDDWEVGRIIARPFAGKSGNFYRLNDKRKDYPLSFSEKTVMNYLSDAGFDTICFGEVGELFNMNGISFYEHTTDNEKGVDFIKKNIKTSFHGIVFGNLADFDMLYGHRRDVLGYKKALEHFDYELGNILDMLDEDDLLIITADHGNDPTFKGTDHTREYVPLLIFGKNCKSGIDLGTRATYADLGKTIADNFGLDFHVGTSFLDDIKHTD